MGTGPSRTRAKLSVALDHLHQTLCAPKGSRPVMKVGGDDAGVRRGGYIWIGDDAPGAPCAAFIGIGKLLRLARAIEKHRAR